MTAPASTRPRVGMDPRIHRRRLDVRQAEERRRMRSLGSAFAVVALAALAVLATRSPLLDVDYVDVQGAEHTPRQALLRATGLDRGPLLIDVRPAEVARRARTLPWVASARAEKQWPGTVRITVVERKAVAGAAAAGGGYALVDGDGLVLEVTPRPPSGITVTGVPAAPAPGKRLTAAASALRVAAAVPVHLQDRVREATPVAGGEVQLRMSPTGIVRFGPPEDIARKMQALETMMAKVDLRRFAVLDVRVPTSPVLTRR